MRGSLTAKVHHALLQVIAMDAPTPAGGALRRVKGGKKGKGRGDVHRETCYHPQNASKAGKNKVLYFTHVHKSGGTTMCGLAKRHHCLVNAVSPTAKPHRRGVGLGCTSQAGGACVTRAVPRSFAG